MKQIVTNLFDNLAILAKIMKILYNVRQTVSQNKSYLWAKSSKFSHDRTHKLFVVENIKASFDIFLSFWFLYLSYNMIKTIADKHHIHMKAHGLNRKL